MGSERRMPLAERSDVYTGTSIVCLVDMMIQ